MSGNSIFRGPTRRIPETVNLPVSGAYLPGLIVASDGTNLALTTDPRADILVLTNVEFSNQTKDVAYTSGDTGIAYVPLAGDTYQVRMAAGTYALGAKLTVDSNSRLAAAGDEGVVVAYCDQAGTFSAGDLADVRWASRVTTPAA